MERITFGMYLKQQRLQQGYGLREFARLLDMHPSNLSNLERDKLPPPHQKASLDIIAEALGFDEHDPRRATLFDLAVAERPDRLPADLVEYVAEVKVVPLLLRRLAEKRLSEEQICRLVQDITALY